MAWLLIGVAALAVLLLTRSLLRARRDRALRAERQLRLAQELLVTDLGALDGAADRVARATTPAQLREAVASYVGSAARPVCFFDPAHGPSTADVAWPPSSPQASPSAASLLVPACARCSGLLVAGAAPTVRTVRREGRAVPWFEAGPAYDAYAHAWFGDGPAQSAVALARAAAAAPPESRGEGDQVGWARGSLGGLGEAPPAVHHRLGQLAADQQRHRHP
ncbi:hypothetical protein H5V45_11720 [Nocardioides sp. KIGAM211]|uniref:Uncharacterized protein n=1 Tax=Nocardioides luti TaxID=2761101 RepID=A0A7X0RH05_9ACTN|nr:hypothetical protein [Nocardioides luti]MBB6627985.1 hypothetical protein [Nocardioides luti]